jgi:hypothetical protein
MAGISEFIDTLVKDSTTFAREELKALVKDAKEDNRLFIKHMGELTEEFIKLRALNQIDNSEFEELMKDVVNLNKMQFQKLSVAAKARAQRIADGLTDLVLNSLLKLI